MPRGWDFFFAKCESLQLRSMYADLRQFKFKAGKNYALKNLQMTNTTFYPPSPQPGRPTPLKLESIFADSHCEYPLDKFETLTNLESIQ